MGPRGKAKQHLRLMSLHANFARTQLSAQTLSSPSFISKLPGSVSYPFLSLPPIHGLTSCNMISSPPSPLNCSDQGTISSSGQDQPLFLSSRSISFPGGVHTTAPFKIFPPSRLWLPLFAGQPHLIHSLLWFSEVDTVREFTWHHLFAFSIQQSRFKHMMYQHKFLGITSPPMSITASCTLTTLKIMYLVLVDFKTKV